MYPDEVNTLNNNNQDRPSRVQLYDSNNKKRSRGSLFKGQKSHHPKKPGNRGKKAFKILFGILLAILLVCIIVFIVK